LLLSQRVASTTPENAHARQARAHLAENLQSLSTELRGDHGQPRDISAGAGQARDEPLPHGIATAQHDDGDRLRRLLGGESRDPALGDDDIHFETDQLGRQIRKPFSSSVCVPDLEGYVPSFDVTQLAQALSEHVEAIGCFGRRADAEVPEPVDLSGLLALGGHCRNKEDESKTGCQAPLFG